MEKAVCDLNDLFKHWEINSEPLHFIDDLFSLEKFLYLLIQGMNLLLTLHKENVCCGDFKPHNCLLFHTYTLKLGDFGGCVKITNDMKNLRRGFTEKFSQLNKKEDNYFSKKELFGNDIYSLLVSFQTYFNDNA